MVVHWMERFKHGDIRSVKFQKQIIDYFVNAVYVYDDRIVLTYNFKDDSKTITLEEVNRIFQEELTGSSLTSCGEPKKEKSARYSGTFLFAVVTEFSAAVFALPFSFFNASRKSPKYLVSASFHNQKLIDRKRCG